MCQTISLKSTVELGVVPTHLKFVGGLVPDADGRLPRYDNGALKVVEEMAQICAKSSAKVSCVQIPVFPGVEASDTKALITGLQELGLQVHLILMVGGADPMSPADEDRVVAMLSNGLQVAKTYGVEHISSTSMEEWMKPGAKPKLGADFDAAVSQVVRVHTRAIREFGDLGSVKNWHFEFLRGGEFQTFTDVAKCWAIAQSANRELGRPFFKVLLDAAHCGDSALSIPENEDIIRQMGESGEVSLFHASAKTTRGCLSTDDGWIGALLSACARTGKLEQVFVELFHHEDPALEGLRELDSGHGRDTSDGRTYQQTVIDGLVDCAHRLNNLVVRGILPAK